MKFEEALSNFVNDFAGGADVRHMADLGLTVSEISEKLDYPLPKDKIGQIVFEHFINTGKICLEKPEEKIEKVSYVKDTDSFGRTSMRRVTEPVDISARKYVAVDFGTRLYKDRKEFEKCLEGLQRRDREYILEMPWPLGTVYHEMDERMRRIADAGII